MPTFDYKYKDEAGMVHRGRREADDAQILATQLAEAGYESIQVSADVRPSPVEEAAALNQTAAQFVSLEEVKAFTCQLVELLNEGQLINTALENLAKQQQNKHLQQILMQLHRAEVVFGNSFGEAIAQYPNVFGKDYIAKVQQAEQSGSSRDLLVALSALGGSQATELRSQLNWQKIEQDSHGTISRTKVPGGWLIKVTYFISIPVRTEDTATATSISFYPDPTHQWDGTSLP